MSKICYYSVKMMHVKFKCLAILQVFNRLFFNQSILTPNLLFTIKRIERFGKLFMIFLISWKIKILSLIFKMLSICPSHLELLRGEAEVLNFWPRTRRDLIQTAPRLVLIRGCEIIASALPRPRPKNSSLLTEKYFLILSCNRIFYKRKN